MGAITGTVVDLGGSALSGDGEKLIQVTCVPCSASDTITLTNATHGIRSITAVISSDITGGLDTNFATCVATASDLVITLVNYEGDGTAGTDWTSAAARITLLGKM